MSGARHVPGKARADDGNPRGRRRRSPGRRILDGRRVGCGRPIKGPLDRSCDPPATLTIDVGGTTVDIETRPSRGRRARKINDAAVSVGATSFTPQVDAAYRGFRPRPFTIRAAAPFAKAIKSVVSVLMAGGGSEECCSPH